MHTNPNYLLTNQYQTSTNLDARIQLHLRFSVNPLGWQRWVFEQLDLPADSRIIELGCGSGKLWLENQESIPPGWEITLSDFSPGMVAQAQQNLARAAHPFRFEQVDAQAIPFDEASFDAVIANHMLYHLPNLAQGLGEIRRVLKPGGRLYAATNGAGHLRELDDLIFQFDPHLGIVQQTALEFTLESGAGLLAPFFGAVTLIRYPDALLVTEAAPLAAYILSMIRYESVKQELDEKLLSYIEAVLQKNNGQIHIGKDAGLFLALR